MKNQRIFKKIFMLVISMALLLQNQVYAVEAGENETVMPEELQGENETVMPEELQGENETNDVGKTEESWIEERYEENSISQEKAAYGDMSKENADLAVSREKILQINVKNNKIIVETCVEDKNVQTVVFPVWTERNGQDDLQWYDAVKEGDTWKAEIDLKNHGYASGIYNIHVYGYHSDGRLHIITGEKTKVDCTLNGQVKIVNKDDAYGRFQIQIGDICAPFDIKRVMVAVWSEKDGQDDLQWYKAQKIGETEIVDIDAMNHNADEGDYNVHVYYVDAQERFTFVQGQKVSVLIKEKGKTHLEILHEKADSKVSVMLSNYNGIENESEIYFPIWSEKNGQDDIKWYKAQKINNFIWKANIDLKNHNYESGKYNIHAYVKKADGNMHLMAAEKMNITDLFTGRMQIIDKNDKEGTYSIKIKDVSAPYSNVNIKVPVWSEENGQDDIQWYTARKKGNDWYVDVDAANHQYSIGKYHMHLYYFDDQGTGTLIQAMVTEINFDVSGKPNLIAKKNADQSEITVSLFNVAKDSNVENIIFPIWSDINGQDDIKWYSAQNIGPSAWQTTIKIKDHKGDTGKYIIHAYKQLKNGKMETVEGTSIFVDSINTISKIEMVDIDKQLGKFRVQIRDIQSPAKITDIRFPVWSEENGQDDIVWYSAVKKDNMWYADIDAGNHLYSQGLYNIHCYAYDARGAVQYLGASTKTVNVEVVTDGNISSSLVATSWIIYDQKSDRILFARNPDGMVQLASQSKIMTAMVVLEHVSNLDAVVTMTPSANSGWSWEMTRAGLVVGRQYTVRSLLQGLLVYSGGDCAGLLAEYVGGTRENFVRMMNAKARELGMQNTVFSDPVGLYDNHTTPREYIKLVRYADNNQIFRDFVKLPVCIISDTQGKNVRRLASTNALVSGDVAYDKSAYIVDGMKSGYTDEAGYCLTASAYDSRKRIIVAAFNSSGYRQRAIDCRTLLNKVLIY